MMRAMRHTQALSLLLKNSTMMALFRECHQVAPISALAMHASLPRLSRWDLPGDRACRILATIATATTNQVAHPLALAPRAHARLELEWRSA